MIELLNTRLVAQIPHHSKCTKVIFRCTLVDEVILVKYANVFIIKQLGWSMVCAVTSVNILIEPFASKLTTIQWLSKRDLQ